MKKKNFIKGFILLIICFFSLSTYACSNKIEGILTDDEIMLQAIESINYRFRNNKIYSNLSLSTYLTIENKYLINLTWTSSNQSVLDANTGNINRTTNDQNVILTAQLSYKEYQQSLVYSLTIPGNQYTKGSPNFSDSANTGKQIKLDIKSLTISNNKLFISIFVLNVLQPQITLKGITKIENARIYIKSYNNVKYYLVNNLTYTNGQNNQFICQYNHYVTIELPELPSEQFNSSIELSTNKFYIDFQSITYTY